MVSHKNGLVLIRDKIHNIRDYLNNNRRTFQSDIGNYFYEFVKQSAMSIFDIFMILYTTSIFTIIPIISWFALSTTLIIIPNYTAKSFGVAIIIFMVPLIFTALYRIYHEDDTEQIVDTVTKTNLGGKIDDNLIDNSDAENKLNQGNGIIKNIINAIRKIIVILNPHRNDMNKARGAAIYYSTFFPIGYAYVYYMYNNTDERFLYGSWLTEFLLWLVDFTLVDPINLILNFAEIIIKYFGYDKFLSSEIAEFLYLWTLFPVKTFLWILLVSIPLFIYYLYRRKKALNEEAQPQR